MITKGYVTLQIKNNLVGIFYIFYIVWKKL